MLAADQVIAIRHEIMVVENGRDRIVLQHVSPVRTSGVGAGGGNQITAVRKLELEKTYRNGVQVEQRVRYRTGGTLNLYAAVRGRGVEIPRPVARRLWAERRRYRGHGLLPRAITLRGRRPSRGAVSTISRP